MDSSIQHYHFSYFQSPLRLTKSKEKITIQSACALQNVFQRDTQFMIRQLLTKVLLLFLSFLNTCKRNTTQKLLWYPQVILLSIMLICQETSTMTGSKKKLRTFIFKFLVKTSHQRRNIYSWSSEEASLGKMQIFRCLLHNIFLENDDDS